MKRFQNEFGATQIEYALLLALIAMVCIPTFAAITTPISLQLEHLALVTGGSEGTDDPLSSEVDPDPPTPIGVLAITP